MELRYGPHAKKPNPKDLTGRIAYAKELLDKGERAIALNLCTDTLKLTPTNQAVFELYRAAGGTVIEPNEHPTLGLALAYKNIRVGNYTADLTGPYFPARIPLSGPQFIPANPPLEAAIHLALAHTHSFLPQRAAISTYQKRRTLMTTVCAQITRTQKTHESHVEEFTLEYTRIDGKTVEVPFKVHPDDYRGHVARFNGNFTSGRYPLLLRNDSKDKRSPMHAETRVGRFIARLFDAPLADVLYALQESQSIGEPNKEPLYFSWPETHHTSLIINKKEIKFEHARQQTYYQLNSLQPIEEKIAKPSDDDIIVLS